MFNLTYVTWAANQVAWVWAKMVTVHRREACAWRTNEFQRFLGTTPRWKDLRKLLPQPTGQHIVVQPHEIWCSMLISRTIWNKARKLCMQIVGSCTTKQLRFVWGWNLLMFARQQWFEKDNQTNIKHLHTLFLKSHQESGVSQPVSVRSFQENRGEVIKHLSQVSQPIQTHPRPLELPLSLWR